jgi:hypothetical protein
VVIARIRICRATAALIVVCACWGVRAGEWYSLEGPWSVPAEITAALNAAAAKVSEHGYSPREFRATVSCTEECDVGVYPQELDTDAQYRSYRGCPLKYCATLTYSKRSGAIVKEIGWR